MDTKSYQIIRVNETATYYIKDTFHDFINHGAAPLVTNTMFDSDEEFFGWCRQHGADNKWIKGSCEK